MGNLPLDLQLSGHSHLLLFLPPPLDPTDPESRTFHPPLPPLFPRSKSSIQNCRKDVCRTRAECWRRQRRSLPEEEEEKSCRHFLSSFPPTLYLQKWWQEEEEKGRGIPFPSAGNGRQRATFPIYLHQLLTFMEITASVERGEEFPPPPATHVVSAPPTYLKYIWGLGSLKANLRNSLLGEPKDAIKTQKKKTTV